MNRKSRGFTLIEVMVAVAVIGLAATALFSLLSTSLFNLRRVEDLHRVQLAGEGLMNRVLLIAALPPSADVRGRIDDLDAQWLVRIRPWLPKDLEGHPPAAVMKVDVEIRWQGRAGERTTKLETVRPAVIDYNSSNLNDAIQNILPN